ncbi:IS600 ORF1-like protein [Escherichia coli]|uniref:IS600 ORF1-like protein n=1 Tax=Escherichia coli TaxID=562 RepID=A0A376P8P3_ECOLX|nr:IS600 ORF1-like protein [Escherichia coli]
MGYRRQKRARLLLVPARWLNWNLKILQLRKAFNEARLERDILKKATAYFAQESLKNTR